MITITKYRIINRNGIYYAVSDQTVHCPDCGGELKIRDSRRRHVILAENDVRDFSLRRLKCLQCGSLHLEIPDLIVPHKHYSRDVIENALNGCNTGCPAENSTIYRWGQEKNATSRQASSPVRTK